MESRIRYSKPPSDISVTYYDIYYNITHLVKFMYMLDFWRFSKKDVSLKTDLSRINFVLYSLTFNLIIEEISRHPYMENDLHRVIINFH